MLVVAWFRRSISGATPWSGSVANRPSWHARPEAPPQSSSGAWAGLTVAVLLAGWVVGVARRPGLHAATASAARHTMSASALHHRVLPRPPSIRHSILAR